MDRLSTRARMACLALALSPALAVAGRDSEAPAETGQAGPNAVTLGDVAQNPSPTQLEAAAVVPGFGGYFLDGQGYPTVYLTDAARRPAAEQALSAFLADRGFTASDLRVLQGSYGYAQLDGWYRLARASVFQVPGIVLGDVDEGLNRLRFGVTNPASAGSVLGALTALDIPVGAILIEQHAGYRALTTHLTSLPAIAGERHISAGRAEPVQGEVAHKTSTTGWTQGVTIATCVDLLAVGANYIRLCQTEVAALVDGDDNGPPVVYRRGATNNVVLLGILWAASVDKTNPSFSYSPTGSVEREIISPRVD